MSDLKTTWELVMGDELIFMLAASNAGITPKVLDWYYDAGLYRVITESYPITLEEDLEPGKRSEQIVALVQKLHSIGIYHNFLDEEFNIAVNPETNEVRLINFCRSMWISDLSDISFINEIYGKDWEKTHKIGLHKAYNGKCTTREEALKYEIDEVQKCCEISQGVLDTDAELCRDQPGATSFFHLDLGSRNKKECVILRTEKDYKNREWVFSPEDFTESELRSIRDGEFYECGGCITMPTAGFEGKNTWCALSRKIAILQETSCT